MLTDLFAVRYESVPLFKSFSKRERRLFHQAFTILEDVHPFWGEKESGLKSSTAFWKTVHKRVANELGMQWLSDPYYTTHVGLAEYRREETRQRPELELCRNWLKLEPTNSDSFDGFVKERTSLIEVGFREIYDSLESMRRAQVNHGDLSSLMKEPFQRAERIHNEAAQELNIRFKLAMFPLHYHNGFVQILSDDLISVEIEQPFWSLVSDPLWENVDLDMKEALDQRDSGGKDPAIFAAKALESVIKIISGGLSLTHGGERGAHNFIDNIGKNGVSFVDRREVEMLKDYFTKVRNPLGHGPGGEPMPTLSFEQSRWAIEYSMSWIRLLVDRYQARPREDK